MRKLKNLITIIIVAFALFLFATPYYAVSKLKTAAEKNDYATIEKHVDITSLRESLKIKLRAIVSKGLEAKGETKESEVMGALGQVIINALIDPIVNGMITPQTIAAMINGKSSINKIGADKNKTSESILSKDTNIDASATIGVAAVEPAVSKTEPQVINPLAEKAEKAKPFADVKVASTYTGLNSFIINVIDINEPESKVTFHMKRDGLLNWKVYDIELPSLEKLQADISNKFTPKDNAVKTDELEEDTSLPESAPATTDEVKPAE